MGGSISSLDLSDGLFDPSDVKERRRESSPDLLIAVGDLSAQLAELDLDNDRRKEEMFVFQDFTRGKAAEAAQSHDGWSSVSR